MQVALVNTGIAPMRSTNTLVHALLDIPAWTVKQVSFEKTPISNLLNLKKRYKYYIAFLPYPTFFYIYIRIKQYINNITFYCTIYNYYYTTQQGLNHGEQKDNDYPMANKQDTQALNSQTTTLNTIQQHVRFCLTRNVWSGFKGTKYKWGAQPTLPEEIISKLFGWFLEQCKLSYYIA